MSALSHAEAAGFLGRDHVKMVFKAKKDASDLPGKIKNVTAKIVHVSLIYSNYIFENVHLLKLLYRFH